MVNTSSRHAFKKTQNLIRARLTEVIRPLNSELQPVLIRSTARHAVHPIARIRQAKGKWYTTHSTINAAVRRFMSTTAETGSRYNRAAFPQSVTATAVSRLTARAPFASTLRPNLTGGAFPRTAGGYSLGGGRTGGARYFSHTPAAPAQVMNVSKLVRYIFYLHADFVLECIRWHSSIPVIRTEGAIRWHDTTRRKEVPKRIITSTSDCQKDAKHISKCSRIIYRFSDQPDDYFSQQLWFNFHNRIQDAADDAIAQRGRLLGLPRCRLLAGIERSCRNHE